MPDFRSPNVCTSFRFAFAGLRHLITTQRNFRIHLVMAAFVIGLGFFCNISRFDWLAIILTIALMLVAETLNTALESAVDGLADNQYHDAARIAKDVAAAACLLAAGFAVIVGGLVFVPFLIIGF